MTTEIWDLFAKQNPDLCKAVREFKKDFNLGNWNLPSRRFDLKETTFTDRLSKETRSKPRVSDDVCDELDKLYRQAEIDKLCDRLKAPEIIAAVSPSNWRLQMLHGPPGRVGIEGTSLPTQGPVADIFCAWVLGDVPEDMMHFEVGTWKHDKTTFVESSQTSLTGATWTFNRTEIWNTSSPLCRFLIKSFISSLTMMQI